MLLAQVVEAVAEPGVFLGFNADQWTVLVPAILGFLAVVIPLWLKAKGATGKLGAVIHAVELTGETNPGAAALVKARIKEAATKLAVEESLNKDVKRITTRRKNGGRL